ncbi:mucin-2-like [Tachysurus vachellii]|uniref:mucin-2-like n=1 Tax=Tachysurus vachellii TaxID=175792 RepID=UPI00296B1944|nr:mucin-2-like [Tachysurus vachellii]
MAQRRIVLGILVFFSGQFGFVSTQSTNVCKTFGSGVMQTFNGTMFHVKTTCPVTLTHFSHAGVDCFISVQRDQTGIMKRVEIYVNKIATIIQDGILTVEGNSISLPYDHTYQKVYAFGIYTKLTSKVLPFSVTWYSLPMGVTRFWVQLDRPLVDGMTGMCGRQNSSETRAELLDRNVIHDEICVTGDSQPVEDKICNDFKSNARECLGKRLYIFDQLCKLNMYINIHESAKCSFYEEFFFFCNQSYALQTKLRNITSCQEHHCPGDLLYKDQGAAFPPTCSNPQLQTDFQTATCLPPNGLVLNDRVESYYSVKVEDCPCVHRGNIYAPRDKRSTKCQTCECIKGKWICSANTCMTPCIIEGWFVTTFDGKQYSLPGTCTYVASRGLNWTITVRFSAMTIEEIYLDVYQERYTFSLNSVQLRENEITATNLSQTEHVTVYWQSSMFVMVQTSFGMKMQVQVSPEVQMYLYLLQNVTATGLCGSNNNNTEDDFTTSSGIVENSAQSFALSWTLGDCTANNPYACINTNNELFAEHKCTQLTNTSGVFALCHEYVPVNSYLDACIRRTCQASSGLEEHVCVGLGNYAKACASQGIIIGDWRAETACTPSCESNLRFDYTMQACNRTCRSLSGPDPTCDMPDDLVEGCGCPPGTHLNTPLRCSPRALCQCNYPGGTTPPGPVVIDGRQCMCENGYLQCSDNCDCPNGQICVHCAQAPVNTVQKTCESLSKPSSSDQSCISGCYCPEGQYADHNGNCVTQENCTCEFSGMVYASGQAVESNCKTCTCRGGQWDCKGDPCPGVCEVFGNGQYKTFDSKWYRFDGHCQYTLVEDINGLFSINAESVPCCDEVLTCSRAISVKLKDEVTLTLRDMNISQKFLNGWRLRAQSLYSVHTVGLYIIISVPELGLKVIWDKQTKVTIELQTSWNGRVRGLCGDFDGKLMNDLLTRSSTVVFSTLEFGNSWKTAVPPCSDVTQELFPCERHSYCAAWAQRRCMILQSDTFKACHLKVDPTPYYQACILESCSCDFEGKFLGFCTAVAAYAEACTTQNVCIKWRTPDLCPVYCDYYNEEGQCSWHYEACPQHIKTCGKSNKFSGKLEGCYPHCPSEKPYYDENRRICSSLDKCTCYFNNTVVEPGANVTTPSECCECIEGQLICEPCITPPTTIVYTPQTTPGIKTGITSISHTTTTKTTEESTTTIPITTITTDTTLITTTTATETPITQTSQTTKPVIITGVEKTTISPSPQKSNYTTTTPGITTKITEESTTTTPITTITTDTTLITTTATETPITQTSQTTKPVIITGTTTNQASPSPQESTYTTTTPGITTKITEESTTTTPITTITTDTTLITTTSATEIPITQTSLTTKPVIITGTTTNQASPSPPESTYTTTTPGITTKMIEESTTTTPITTITTDTTLITTTTATETPITQTSQTTKPVIITGTTTNQASPSPQESTYTTTTPGITAKITEESTTTTPITTITTDTTLITTTTATETPITQTSQTTKPVIITGTTTNQASPSPQESTYTTTTPGITTKITEESTTTTPITTITTDTTLITTTTATETPITQTSQTTKPVIITGTTTNQASPSPQESTYTTTTPGITTKITEESTTTTPITTITTDTTLITTTATETPITQTSLTTKPVIITGTTTNQASPSPQESTYTTTTPGITTKMIEESTTTTPITTITTDTTLITTTTASETPITQTSQTTKPVIITGTTTNQASPSPQESTYTTTTPGITTKITEESTTTTPITTITTDTTLITTTATETPITQTSLTTKPVIITGTTTNQASPSPQESTYTTTTPGITTKTTEESTTTTPITTITTDTTVIITATSTPEITTENDLTTTLTTTETPITTSTSKITSVPETATPPTSVVTKTPIMTTTRTSEFTSEESASTTPLIRTSATSETSLTKSTTEIITNEPVITTTPSITIETPVTTSKPKTTLDTASTATTIRTKTTSQSIITEGFPSTTLLTTTTMETPITTSTTEITTEESKTTTHLTTTRETQVTNKTSPAEISTEEPTSTTTLTTTETLVTTLTPKITSLSKPTTPVTTTRTETPVTRPTISTTEISTEGTTTPVTIITSKPPVTRTTILTPETTTPLTTTTKTPESTSIPATTTAHYTACYDLIRNQTWPEGYEWTEDCFTKICKNNVIELRPLICPTPVIPVCPRGMPKLMKDKQGCCDTWQCDCQCDVFGDPHYTTFAGQDFTFLENCTYVLVEERTPLYHLSISIDNYYCEPSASCAKGIIVQYQNNTVMLQVVEVPDDIPILQITLNQVTIKAPYQAHGLRFESTDAEVYIYIKEIRSYISLSVWNTLQINLAMEHFFNNTQGQCGVCGGASCIRRNGTVEREDCCDKTAYEWIENDPMKPYCQQAPQHVPCFPVIPPISPEPTPLSCTAPFCDLLRHQVFSECSGGIDVEKLVSSCKFDYCMAQNNASVCSPLERLADHCKKMGTCVAWRNLTSGICDIACPEGMIFDECRSTPTDFCRGSMRVSGTVLDTVRSGCFCPNNQLLAERHKMVCVSECTNCKGPLGEPMLVGATWESNCHMCTCNNQTLTEECWPKPPLPSPICSPGFALISDCCDNQICVEKTCEYSGTIYKVGEAWRDPKTPCLSYRCTSAGTEIERTMCPQQFCPEELRFWDENHCCYSCNTTCGVKLSRMTFENCTQEVMLPTCEGNCASGSFWVRSGIDLKLEHNQSSCRERDYEIRQISLVCSGATATQYTYKHITSCECQREV